MIQVQLGGHVSQQPVALGGEGPWPWVHGNGFKVVGDPLCKSDFPEAKERKEVFEGDVEAGEEQLSCRGGAKLGAGGSV